MLRFKRPVDDLILESCPLHTEKPEWAAKAPSQVEAACKRGAHLIGLTETRGSSIDEAKKIAASYGYTWIQAPMDQHRNVSVLVKKGLTVLHQEAVEVFNNYRVGVTVDFHGSRVTVYVTHWEPSDKGHQVQTAALTAAMTASSKGNGISFYMGDSNPSKPQSTKGSQPNALLSAAGMPVIYEELGHYPAGIGVNVIGRNKADGRVSAADVKAYPALGSDHVPVVATYRVKRPLFRRPQPKPKPPVPHVVKPPSPPYLGPAAHTSQGSNQPIHRIVIHCTVSPCVKGGARATAAYFRTQAAGGSAHYIVDPGEVVQSVYDDTIAWHAPPNQNSIGVELTDALVSQAWDKANASRWKDANHTAMLDKAAALVAQLCLAYGVPIARLSVGDLLAGKHGVCGHVDVSQAWHQSDHWDPGTSFPWVPFMRLVETHAAALKGKR